MSLKQSSPATRIQKMPDVIGGDACIGKTRIAVWMLVQPRKLGMTDEEIRTRYDPPLVQLISTPLGNPTSRTERRSNIQLRKNGALHLALVLSESFVAGDQFKRCRLGE